MQLKIKGRNRRKMEKLKRKKGITLIGLVITIIILLILGGIGVITGQHGIIKNATNAKIEYEIASYIDRIELARGVVAIENMGMVTLDNLIEQIYVEEIVPRGNIRKIDKESAIVKTIEGYLIEITADNVRYIGTGELPEEPVLEPTGIWVSLEGNTLKFYTKEENARNGGGKVYGNVQGIEFARDNVAETIDTPWFVDKEQITKVEFVDEVAPECLAYYFSDLNVLETVDMRNIETINVRNMYGMFLNCRNLKEIDAGSFDTRNVENMGWMFLNCSSLTNLDLSSLDRKSVV